LIPGALTRSSLETHIADRKVTGAEEKIETPSKFDLEGTKESLPRPWPSVTTPVINRQSTIHFNRIHLGTRIEWSFKQANTPRKPPLLANTGS